MTAYASVYKGKNLESAQVVLRSLNFKYLDILIHNLPPEDILLEEKIKQEIKKRIYRGKVEVFIFSAKLQAKEIFIDEKIISQYISQMKILARKYSLRPEIGITDILKLPQVVSLEQKSSRVQDFVLPAAKEALARLLEFKEKEGEAIKEEMTKNLDKLEGNVQRIKKQKPKIRHMENGREDIDEELCLISFYISKLKNKIETKKLEPKGKSIDFLTQEILRELNAASSKTKRKTPALLIVEAKNYLERIREQTQNIE